MTGRAAPAFDADHVVVRTIRRLPLVESVADERLAGLAEGADGWARENLCIEVRDVTLDVSAEVRYNGHVVEPDAKDWPPSTSLSDGLFLSLRKLPQSIADSLPSTKAKDHPQWTASRLTLPHSTNLCGPNEPNHCHLTRPLPLRGLGRTACQRLSRTGSLNLCAHTNFEQPALRSQPRHGVDSMLDPKVKTTGRQK